MKDEGNGIVSFGSMDEMLDYMDRQEKEANERAHPVQRAIHYGDHVLRHHEGFMVFGWLPEKDEVMKGEDRATQKMLGANFERGYRYGKWFSELCPEGEWGDSHVSNLWPIRAEEFKDARDTFWDTRRIVNSQWGIQMLERIREEVTNDRGSMGAEPRLRVVDDHDE